MVDCRRCRRTRWVQDVRGTTETPTNLSVHGRLTAMTPMQVTTDQVCSCNVLRCYSYARRCACSPSLQGELPHSLVPHAAPWFPGVQRPLLPERAAQQPLFAAGALSPRQERLCLCLSWRAPQLLVPDTGGLLACPPRARTPVGCSSRGRLASGAAGARQLLPGYAVARALEDLNPCPGNAGPMHVASHISQSVALVCRRCRRSWRRRRSCAARRSGQATASWPRSSAPSRPACRRGGRLARPLFGRLTSYPPGALSRRAGGLCAL